MMMYYAGNFPQMLVKGEEKRMCELVLSEFNHYNRLISFSKKCVKDFRYSVEHSGQDILGMLELYSKSNNLKYVVTETLVYHYVTGEGLMSEAMQTISQDMYDHYDILLEKIDRLEFKESKYVTID